MRAGDIVLIMFRVKFSKDKFRLGRILRLLPDTHGHVRSVMVGVRDRQKAAREAPDKCEAGLRVFPAPVQRLVVVLPAEEQPQEILLSLADPQNGGQHEEVVGEDAEEPLGVLGEVHPESEQEELVPGSEARGADVGTAPSDLLAPHLPSQADITPETALPSTPLAPLSAPLAAGTPVAAPITPQPRLPLPSSPPRPAPQPDSGLALGAASLPQRTTRGRLRAAKNKAKLSVRVDDPIDEIVDL